MDIVAIRRGVASTLNILPQRVYSYMPDMVNPPCAIVYPEHVAYRETYDRKHTCTFLLTLFAGHVNSRAADELMDKWLGDGTGTSVFDAIENNKTLGGSCDDCRVVELRQWGISGGLDQGSRWLVVEFSLEVFA
jgi:hypothetical protein